MSDKMAESWYFEALPADLHLVSVVDGSAVVLNLIASRYSDQSPAQADRQFRLDCLRVHLLAVAEL